MYISYRKAKAETIIKNITRVSCADGSALKLRWLCSSSVRSVSVILVLTAAYNEFETAFGRGGTFRAQ